MPQTSPAPTGTRQPKKRRGQATVELALAAVFLVLLLVGVADVARIYAERLSVVHAAGVGARWATLDATQRAKSGYNSVCNTARADLRGDLPSGTTITVSSAPQSGGKLRVQITFPHTYFFGVFKPGGIGVPLPDSFTVEANMPVNAGTTPLTESSTCTVP